MKRFTYHILIAAALLSLSSCEDAVEADPLGCNLQSIQHLLNGDSITVVYKLDKSGEAQINSWSYITPAGETIVNNPESPAEVTLLFLGSANPQVKADVVVTDGFVKVSYTAATADSTYVGIDQCVQEIN